MIPTRKHFGVLLFGLLLSLGLAVGNAQTSNGTVTGIITDPTGSVLSGATVTITSVDTGVVRIGTTNEEGTYRIESVLAGTYNLSASARGFETVVKSGLIVPSSTIVSASLALNIGQASDTVEVSADNSTLNTENAQISGTISELEVSNLPISSLNPYQLALTLPGVMSTTQGGFSNGVDYNVGGGRPRSNNFLIEGQDNNDAGIQGQGLQPGNDDAIKEVVIIENAYTAEFGHGAGSVANVIFKSGTNAIHGGLYYRFQNQALDALDKNQVYYQQLCISEGGTAPDCAAEKSKYRENMPGFDIGGPIKKNKLFYFASYQWDYYRSSSVLGSITVPTPAGYDILKQYASSSPNLARAVQVFGDIPTKHAAQITPTGKVTLGPDPVTGVDRGTIPTGVYHRNVPVQYNSPELDLKGDYLITGKDTLNLRYIHNSFIAPIDVWNFCCQFAGFDTNQDGAAHNAGFVEVHNFNPNMVNELRASYGRIGFTFGLPSATTSNPLFGTPFTSGTGFTSWGVPTSMPQGRFHNTYQLQDTLSVTRGKHFFKFGEDIENVRVKDQIPFNYYGSVSFAKSTGSTTVPAPDGGTQSVKYSATANFMDDFAGSGGSVSKNFGNGVARPNLWSQNYFVTDTYHPIPTLSLDLGFRYEFNGSPFNTAATPYPGWDPTLPDCYPILSNGSTQDCHNKQQADFSEFGPRAGIAWSPTILGHHQTVIRLGYGTFYDVVFTNIIDNIQATAPNNASPQLTSGSTSNGNRGAANWLEATSLFDTNPQYKLPTATGLDEPIARHLLNPRTHHWNLNVQQELPWSTTLQVGYIGERGTHLYGNTNVNPFVQYYASSKRVYPTRGQIVIRDNSGDSEYTGLWSELDHKFNHDFLFRASYTYGKGMDDVSEIFTTGNESSYQVSRPGVARGTTDWGPSAYDHRQRLVLTYIWQPRVWHTTGTMQILGNIVNRWAVAGITQFQSGTTHNVEVGYDVNGDGISNDRPILSNPKAPLTTYAWDDSWFYGSSQGTLCSGPSFWWTNDPCHEVSRDSVHWIVPAITAEPGLKTIGRNSIYGPGYQQWDFNIQRSFKLTERFQLDFRGELFNAFNHGSVDTNAYIMNSTLASGVNTDQWNAVDQNYFMTPDTYVNGYRHSRLYVRIRF